MSEVTFTDEARETDRALTEIDHQVDWLALLTPTNLDTCAKGFRESGWREMPELLYPDLPDGFDTLRDRLLALKVRGLGNTDIEALVLEKQRELDRQIQLVRLRGRSGFTMAAIDMFGNVDASLLEAANTVLARVPDEDRIDAPLVDAPHFIAAAREEMARYHDRDGRFDFDVVEERTPGTHLFTSAGNLHVAYDYTCPETRVYPLIQHEIGVHSVTRFNGSLQPLTMLEGGLADYDDLQEGLAVVAEYLCGDMPPSRLRVLAARVVAARMAIDGCSAADIFAAMHEEHGLGQETAFDTTVRALRGGGMTKDALYLDGLIDVLAYLRAGGDVEFLFIGKFAFKQRAMLQHLLDAGFLKPPVLMPDIFTGQDGRQRIAELRKLRVEQLYTESMPA